MDYGLLIFVQPARIEAADLSLHVIAGSMITAAEAED